MSVVLEYTTGGDAGRFRELPHATPGKEWREPVFDGTRRGVRVFLPISKSVRFVHGQPIDVTYTEDRIEWDDRG